MDNTPRVSASMRKMSMTACVCRNLSTRFADGISPSDDCSWTCERISANAFCVLVQWWATESSPLVASWLIVRWEKGSREWFFTTSCQVPTILCLHVTTMVVANTEDDVVTTSVARGAYGFQRRVADVARVLRVLTLLEEAGGDEKPETRIQSSGAMETVSLSASAEKKQGCRAVHDWNVAVSCLFGGTIGLVANRPQAARKHGSCLCWSGRPSSLPNHCYCDWTGRRANPALQV